MSVADALRVYTKLQDVNEGDTCRYTASLVLPKIAAVCDIDGKHRKKWLESSGQPTSPQNDVTSSAEEQQDKILQGLASINAASLHAHMSGREDELLSAQDELGEEETEGLGKTVVWKWQQIPKDGAVCSRQHAVLVSYRIS